jgi:cell division protein FtsZ
MSIKLQLPKLTDLKPRITVVGVGGAGGNALNNMITSGLSGVEFVAANTDAQALAMSAAEHRLQLGVNLTEGLGAGSKPEIGQAAAEEAVEDIRQQLSGSHMCFIAAGMGGGTGTGAAAVIARVAKELGILTVGVVTKPFQFEGARRMRMAEIGIAALRHNVDTLIVIPNQNLFRIATERTTFAEAFLMADQVLHSGVACVVDLIVREGLINLDFADVRTVMANMGNAMMGTGEASGEGRAIEAAEAAIHNPLIDDVSLKGAKGLLLSVTGGRDLTLYEVDEAATRVRQEVDPDANIIVGASFDEALQDKIRVSIVASGISRPVDAGVEAGTPGGAVSDGGALRQRLFGALQTNVDSHAPAIAGQPSHVAVAKQANGWEGSETPLDPLRESATGTTRGTQGAVWKGPGDVSIVEDMPQLVHAPQPNVSRPAGPPSPAPFAQSVPSVFQPAPPADVRGTGRRMPDVSDFPAVGQRAYMAKAHQAEPRAAEQKSERRPRFFARWTNSLQRRLGESPGRQDQSDSVYDVQDVRPEVAQPAFNSAYSSGGPRSPQTAPTALAGNGTPGENQNIRQDLQPSDNKQVNRFTKT